MLKMVRFAAALMLVAYVQPIFATTSMGCSQDEPLADVYSCMKTRAESTRMAQINAADPVADAARANTERFRNFPSGFASPSTQPTLTNFVPLVDVSGIGLGGDDRVTEPNLALTANPDVIGSGLTGDFQISAAVDTTPVIHPVLEDSLREAGASNTLNALQSALDATDALTVSLRVPLEIGSWGRSYGNYAWLIDEIVEDNRQAIRPSQQPPDEEKIYNSLKASGHCIKYETYDPDIKLSDVGTGCRDALLDEFATGAEQYAMNSGAFASSVTSSQLPRFGQLLGNNPQFFVSALYTPESDTVTARYTGVRLSIEMGLTSIFGFMRTRDGQTCDQANPYTGHRCANAYADYVIDRQKRGLIDQSNRFLLSAEYGRLDALDATVDTSQDTLAGAPQNISYSLPEAEVFRARLGYGRILLPPRASSGGQHSVRLDVVGRYDAFSSGDLRSDFWLATATVSYQIGTFSIPFQLQYRSDSEFDIDRNDGLEALIGLAFDWGRSAESLIQGES